jgi:hypothetical protein
MAKKQPKQCWQCCHSKQPKRSPDKNFWRCMAPVKVSSELPWLPNIDESSSHRLIHPFFDYAETCPSFKQRFCCAAIKAKKAMG